MDNQNSIQQSSNQESLAKKAELADCLMSIEFHPKTLELTQEANRGIKIPFGEMAALGTSFASMPESFRTITQTLSPSGDQLYRVVFPEGATGVLKKAKSGNSYGFAKMKEGSSKLAQFVPVSGVQEVKTTIPYDPTTLVVAMALMQINKKLDAIQETQKEMFEYLKTKDRAQQRGDLETLTELLNSYPDYWNNPTAQANNGALVKQVKRSAKASIHQHRELIEATLKKGNPFGMDMAINDKTTNVLAELEELRIAIYLHSFASFLEAILDENFSHENLSKLASSIEEDSVSYRVFYTEAYNKLEKATQKSIAGLALDGMASAFGTIGRTVEKTVIGQNTPIDEAFLAVESGIEGINKTREELILGKLSNVSASDVRPFVAGTQNIDRLYNNRVEFLSDGEYIYLLPSGDEDD